MATFAAIGYPSGENEARNGLGEALLAAGSPRRAEQQHAAAPALAVEKGDRHEQARAHTSLSDVHEALGDANAAARDQGKAQAIEHSLGVLTAEDVT